MIFAAAIVLLAVFSLPLILRWGNGKLREDLFHPLHLACAFNLITTVPFLLLVALDENNYPATMRRQIDDLPEAIVYYALVHAAGFVAFTTGVFTPIGPRLAHAIPSFRWDPSPRKSTQAAIVLFVFGCMAFAVYVVKIGGYEVLLFNEISKPDLAAGMGYTLAFVSPLLTIAPLFLISEDKLKRPAGLLMIAVSVIVCAALLTSLGGRKTTLQVVVFCLLAVHYRARRIRSIPWKAYAVALVLIPYFVIVPLVRMPGAMRYYVENPGELLSRAQENAATVITQLSYVPSYVFVTGHFQPSNVWMGRTYVDLLSAPIPSTTHTEKPPVDDGVYVASLANGFDVSPGTPYKSMYPVSWPVETLGAAYMNFWWPGVLIMMAMLGAVHRAAHVYMARCRWSVHSVYVYGLVALNFHFSNLRLVGFVVVTTVVTLACFLLSRVMRGRRIHGSTRTHEHRYAH